MRKRGKTQENGQWVLKSGGAQDTAGGPVWPEQSELKGGRGNEGREGPGPVEQAPWTAVGSWPCSESGRGLAEYDTYRNTFSKLSADCLGPTVFWKELGTSVELGETGSVAHAP